MSTQAILVVNAGSSSIKFALFEVTDADGITDLLYRGMVDRADTTQGHFSVRDSSGAQLASQPVSAATGGTLDHGAMLSAILDWLEKAADKIDLLAAGHRIVHGGERFSRPVRIDARVMEQLEALAPLAPLHQPHNLDAIRALAAEKPGLAQVACFDTAFHRSQPEVARRFALPRKFTEAGIKRYGFHGLSYEYISSVLPQYLGDRNGGRIVVAHLGNGASMCAIRGGLSVATTMGFTALDGLMMGTRCGALDPGVIVHLLETKKMTPAELTHLLYNESGLLGVSGISGDMRTLLESTHHDAREAVELFAYRAARELGSLASALEGLDALVFTGGIGEHAPIIRALICRSAAWLGVELDEAANDSGGPGITKANSKVSAWVIPVNEEWVIAKHTWQVLNPRGLLKFA